MNYNNSDNYCFDQRDRALIASAAIFLRKVVTAESLQPAETVSVAKVLHVVSRLPKPPAAQMSVMVTVVSPRRNFGDVETRHWWEVGVKGDKILIANGGHLFTTSTGSDTFTTMLWTANPGVEPDFTDYRDHLAAVFKVKSFPDAIASLDLANDEYKVEINDSDNPLLQVYSDEELAHDEDELHYDEDNDRVYCYEPRNAGEGGLVELIDWRAIARNKPQYTHVWNCDVCGCEASNQAFIVHGSLIGRSEWANMCTSCFFKERAGIGWGVGQLYALQKNGDFRLVAGFPLREIAE
jgi:hypothetical protein